MNPVVISALLLPSLTMGAIQDWEDREVSDYIWIPSLLAGMVTVWYFPGNLELLLTMGLMGLGLLLKGIVGEGDAIALAVIGMSGLLPTGLCFVITFPAQAFAVRYLGVKKGEIPVVTMLFVGLVLSIPLQMVAF